MYLCLMFISYRPNAVIKIIQFNMNTKNPIGLTNNYLLLQKYKCTYNINIVYLCVCKNMIKSINN